MNLLMNQQRLLQVAKEQALRWRELRQLSQRMLDLKPTKIKGIYRTYRGEFSSRAATRRAYLDPRYLDYIDELTELRGAKELAKIEFETHRMLFEARQSLRLYQLAVAEAAGGQHR